MKKLSFIALASLLIVGLTTGMAFADAFQVTANFGVRVTEQGASERVGSITLSPNEIGTDVFVSAPTAQIITVELLGNATISRSFGAFYAYDGGDALGSWDPDVDPTPVTPVGSDYVVTAIEGNDFFNIEILADSVGGETVVVGHTEADGTDDSALCFNLVGTIYNPSDPARQLVQVSYADNLSNTYSGDIYVATVKTKSVVVDLCSKALPTEIIEEDGVLAQGEDCGFGSGTICMFTFEDNAAGALLGDYEFTLGKTTGAKVGVGFADVHIYKWDTVLGDWDLVTDLVWAVGGIVERRNSDGDAIVAADFDSDEELWANTSEIVIAATLTGPGLYRADAEFEYNTCIVQPGIWTIDIYANRVPCGGSWSELDWDIVELTTPATTPTSYVYPYCVANVGTWYNGLVFTVPTTAAGSITIDVTLVEADGDVYTGQTSVAPGHMAVGFVADVLNPTTTGSDAAFGDEAYAMYASGDGLFYTFLFMANGNQAQGYLPLGVSMH